MAKPLPKTTTSKQYNKANYQKNTNMVAESEFAGQSPRVARVKTDGRIGSVTPPSFLKGGFTADNNSKAQPHGGGLGAVAATHMSTNPKGETWSPRAGKARAMASAGRKAMSRPHTNPINAETPALKRGVKPT